MQGRLRWAWCLGLALATSLVAIVPATPAAAGDLSVVCTANGLVRTR